MQSLELFILESQSARRRLLEVFALPDDYELHMKRKRNSFTQVAKRHSLVLNCGFFGESPDNELRPTASDEESMVPQQE
jgi:hypothetical protein